MKLTYIAVLALSSVVLAQGQEHFSYPRPPQSGQQDDYFGTMVADPYRPLEDLDSPDSRKWVEEENKLTFDYLEKIPERKRINDRLTTLWNYERYGVPFHEKGSYFYSKNTGLQNQSEIYRATAIGSEANPLLDPNTLSPDGTVALSGLTVSQRREISGLRPGHGRLRLAGMESS